jgi:hypothetical protein
MKVIIAGSRTITDKDFVYKCIEESGFNITIAIVGGAEGVDKLGENWAKEKGIKIISVRPNWTKFGRAAGVIRNEEMAQKADAVIVIWDGKSRGSSNMIMNAKKYGLKLKVFER